MKKLSLFQKRALIGVIVLSLALFSIILLFHEKLRPLDLAANHALNGYGTKLFYPFSVISFFGSVYFIPIAFLLVLWALWKQKKKRTAILLAVAVVSNYVVVNAIKVLTGWTRPQEVARTIEQTFPSAHASTPFVLFVLSYLFLAKQPKKSHLVLIVLGSLLIGYARVIVNAHWLTDVIGGILLALVWISAALLFYKK